MSDFDLASLDEDFANAQAPEKKGPVPIPDGQYHVRIDNFNLIKAKTSGEPMLTFELVIMAGDYSKRKLFRNAVINHNTLPFLKRDLAMLGWTGKLSDLEKHDERRRLLDVNLEVSVKNKGEDAQGRANTNVYFNKTLSKPETVVVTDEPTPF